MGLFDAIAGQVLGSLTGGQNGTQTGQVGGAAGQADILKLVMALMQNKEIGGLSGLINMFQSKGLGDVVSSWVGTGQNQAISGEQLQSALGSDTIASLAKQLGLSPDMLTGQLAQMLPQVVDKLTPDGQVPADNGMGAGDLLGGGLGSLGGLLKGLGR
jgi:uncharacterized protein YidB (DUF937 family)